MKFQSSVLFTYNNSLINWSSVYKSKNDFFHSEYKNSLKTNSVLPPRTKKKRKRKKKFILAYISYVKKENTKMYLILNGYLFEIL